MNPWGAGRTGVCKEWGSQPWQGKLSKTGNICVQFRKKHAVGHQRTLTLAFRESMGVSGENLEAVGRRLTQLNMLEGKVTRGAVWIWNWDSSEHSETPTKFWGKCGWGRRTYQPESEKGECSILLCICQGFGTLNVKPSTTGYRTHFVCQNSTSPYIRRSSVRSTTHIIGILLHGVLYTHIHDLQ
jgi:hypothetical protein